MNYGFELDLSSYQNGIYEEEKRKTVSQLLKIGLRYESSRYWVERMWIHKI